MKVDNKNVGQNASVQSTQTSRAKDIAGKGKADKAVATAVPDFFPGASKVEVSDRAQMMAKAKAIAKNDSIDEAKVARIQKMIDDGKYKVDAEKIADKLVDEHILSGE